MFFSDANNYENYSIFGNRINELKFNEFKNSHVKFELKPFLQDSEYDNDWHEHVLETLSEKGSKLINPYFIKRPIQNKDQAIKSKNKEEKTAYTQPKQNEYRPVSPKLDGPEKRSEIIEKTIVSNEQIQEDHTAVISEKKSSKSETKHVQQKQSFEQNNKETFQNPIERRTFNLMKHWYPLKFKIPYPRKSLLNAYEQKEFIEFYNRFKDRAKISQSEVRLYKKYLHYKSQVEKERVEFFDYLQEYYKAANEDYEFMNHSIEQYVNEMISYKNECVNKFDKYYQKLFDLSMKQLEENSHHKTLFQLEKNLLSIGHLHKIVIPSITKDLQPNMIIDYQRISKKIPMSKKSKILSKNPLYEDKNIERLALKYNCQIAMTNSAFVHLVYHLSFVNSDELKLPIVIKDLKREDGKTQKIILLEKPFIEKYLSKREINEKFYKKSLLVTLVKNQAGPLRHKVFKHNPDSELKSSPIREPERFLEKLNIDYGVVSNFESFGVDSNEKDQLDELIHHNQEETQINKIKKRNRVSNDSALNVVASKKMKSNNSSDYEDYGDETDNDDLVIVERNIEKNQKIYRENELIKKDDRKIQIENEEAPLSPEKTLTSVQAIPKVIPLDKNLELNRKKSEIQKQNRKETSNIENTEDRLSLFDLISKLQDKLVEKPIISNQPHTTSHQETKANQLPIENPQEYNYSENIHGNLNYSLWNLDSIKIIVRSSTAGYVNTEHSSMNPIVMHPKIEYQPQFGCERLSIKDYCKMWAKSILRNYCDIYLCRINVFTNKLISATKIKFDKLLPQDLQFNTNQTLNHLKGLIKKIQILENGSYLLNKDTADKKFEILKSTNEINSGTTEIKYDKRSNLNINSKKPSYWMPIDTEIYLPFHYKLNKVPGMFDPQNKKSIKGAKRKSAKKDLKKDK